MLDHCRFTNGTSLDISIADGICQSIRNTHLMRQYAAVGKLLFEICYYRCNLTVGCASWSSSSMVEDVVECTRNKR